MPEERSKIVARLKRLLAVTEENGATEHEALAAAEKDSHLMAKHDLNYRNAAEIEAEEYKNDARQWYAGREGRKKSAPIPKTLTCLPAICKLCDVEFILDSYTGKLTFFGAPHATEIAHFLEVVIRGALEREWATYRNKVTRASRSARVSFMNAMAKRIAERLTTMAQEEKERTSPEGQALVLVKNALVQERFLQANPGLVIRTKKLQIKDMVASQAGKNAGNRTNLAKGLNEAQGARAIGKA